MYLLRKNIEIKSINTNNTFRWKSSHTNSFTSSTLYQFLHEALHPTIVVWSTNKYCNSKGILALQSFPCVSSSPVGIQIFVSLKLGDGTISCWGITSGVEPKVCGAGLCTCPAVVVKNLRMAELPNQVHFIALLTWLACLLNFRTSASLPLIPDHSQCVCVRVC